MVRVFGGGGGPGLRRGGVCQLASRERGVGKCVRNRTEQKQRKTRGGWGWGVVTYLFRWCTSWSVSRFCDHTDRAFVLRLSKIFGLWSFERASKFWTRSPRMNITITLLDPQKMVYGVTFDTRSFEMRKCGIHPMWSIVFRSENKWRNVCFVSNAHPPLRWMVRFISSGAHTLRSLRDLVLFNKLSP